MYKCTPHQNKTMQPPQLKQLNQLNQLNQSSSSKNPFHTVVIEAWLHPLSALTPSLIAHNLELQGIQLPHSVTITIDRGHYDCTGSNYALIGVRAKSPIAFNLHHNPTTQKNSFYCSFFSQKVTPGTTDPAALNPHWLGNCCVFLGADFETHVLQRSSYRHEPGHVRTWRKIDPEADKAEAEPEAEPEPEADLSEDAVSVGPTNPSPNRANANANANANAKIKFNALNAKDNLRIIQLQKKNVALRTELGAMKSELDSLKAELGAVKADMCTKFEPSTNLVPRLNEQEVWIKRANQCMQDWTNRQVIERVWMLETQHAQLRSEHLKQKEQQKHLDLQQQLKKQHAQHAQHESACAEMLERLTHLEAAINPTNMNGCNKCNENCNNYNNHNNPNPFDFSAIYDHYDKTHYLDGGDLIANHYASVAVESAVASTTVVEVASASVSASAAADNDQDDDDDMFELIQIDPSFNFPSAVLGAGALSK